MSNPVTSERVDRVVSRPARFLALGLTALVAVVTAIGAPASVHAQAAPTGTLRVGWTPPVSLDPALYSDAPDASIGVAVYDYLFTINRMRRFSLALPSHLRPAPMA